jgi:ribonuclease P protein component
MVRRRFLDLRFLHEPGGPLQLGVTIPKKVGNAVRRNRLRRRIREFARLQPHDVFTGDVVVHCRPGAAELAGGTLWQELDGLWTALRRHSP